MNVIEGQANRKKQFSLIFYSLTFNNILNIIVMLILVGVSVTVALNGGLFSTAKQATNRTQLELDKEQLLSAALGAIGEDGKVDFSKLQIPEGFTESDGVYTSKSGNKFRITEYGSVIEVTEGGSDQQPGDENGAEGETPGGETPGGETPGGEGPQLELPTGWEVTTKPETWTSDKVTAIKETATGNIVALPEGYSISEVEDEQTVDGGLVITDGTNEFVWIPLAQGATFANSYYTDKYSEPKELTSNYSSSSAAYDSQKTLNYLYGGYYYYPNTFAYSAHYKEMVSSVNTYGGFYIGRYETTIDGNTIGVQQGKTVLTAATLLKEGTNTTSNEKYHYRWWGLYAGQRNANVVGNGTTVQTNMIWGQQWDAMITYFGSKDYSSTPLKTLAISGKQNAGQAQYTYNSETISDEICNIFDLRGNTEDWTAEAYYTSYSNSRAYRGGSSGYRSSAADRNYASPINSTDYTGSRLALYIK